MVCGFACGEIDDRPSTLEQWREKRARLDETVWADERLAQQYERTLVTLWDALLQADRRGERTDKARILAELAVERVTIGTPDPVEALDHGIERFVFAAPHRSLTATEWSGMLSELADAGYRLVQSEWHHARFEPRTDEAPARSLVSIVLHIEAPGETRMIVEGELGVEWSEEPDRSGNFVPLRVDATALEMFTRTGPPAFERIFSVRSPRRPDDYSGIHPLLLYDLDLDGRIDIVMVRAARILWNREGGFEIGRLIDGSDLLTEAAVIADFNGDMHPDLLATRARGDLAFYAGDGLGHFKGEPLATVFEQPLLGPSVLTAGDIDGDGDLDVWLGQYKPAYAGGQMPSPFYDANDGYPAYLLLNDGAGRFTPATQEAGLAEKRFRRTYTASFVDLDRDDDLDLLVVSDYSGVDLYHNDGTGHFSDANATLRGDRHLFGMSAAFADYDVDGRLDFFVAGMGSTTARRLESLGLMRTDRPEVTEMRMRMAFGNRLYFARDEGWQESAAASRVARTGWTWGTTAFDFDNDGDPDLFVANGHQSGVSTDDYCSNFWSHDLYDGVSESDPVLAQLFSEEAQGLLSGEMSWDGYQKNHLLMNRGDKGFVDVAFLLGIADQFDSRSAVSADLDRDGRVDLLVTEHLGTEGEQLHIYRNLLDTGNAWVGVDLRESGKGISPIGASVTIRTTGRTHVGRVLTGESLMAQHAATLNFGLGSEERVVSIEVRWLNGTTRLLHAPEPNRYHLVRPSSIEGHPEVLDTSLDIPVDVLRGAELFEAILSEPSVRSGLTAASTPSEFSEASGDPDSS